MTIQVQFPGDSSYTDISSYVRYDSIRYDKQLFNRDYRATTDLFQFSIKYDSTIYSDFLSANDYILISVDDSETDVFTGVIEPSFNIKKNLDIVGDLHITATDNSYRLKWKNKISFSYPTTVGGTALKIFDTSTPTDSIIGKLLDMAGYDTSTEIQAGLSNIDTTIKHVSEKAKNQTYWNIIDDILWEHGYVFYFDASGKWAYESWIKDAVSSSYTISEDSTDSNKRIQNLTIEKKYIEEDGVEVEYAEVDEKEDALLYRENVPYDSLGNRTGIAIADGSYHPLTGNAEDIYWNYTTEWLDEPFAIVDNDELNLIASSGHSIIDQYDSGLTRSETYESKRAKVLYSNSSGSTLRLYFSDIHGDALYRKARRYYKIFVQSHSGDVQSGSNNTIQLDAGASSTDDYYNGWSVICNGEEKDITDYDGSTVTATIDGTWTTNPSVGDTFNLVPPTTKVKDVLTKYLYTEDFTASTEAKRLVIGLKNTMKYGDMTYTFTASDSYDYGDVLTLQQTNPLIDMDVIVYRKQKTDHMPMYKYEAVGISAYSAEELLENNYILFADNNQRSINALTVAASDYHGWANYYCDGTADQSEITSAISELNTNFSGGTVMLTAGTYYFTAAPTHSNNIVIEGQGPKTIINVASDINAFDLSTYDNCIIRNMKIEYGGTSEISKYLITGTGNRNTVKDCIFDHPGCLGVILGGTGCRIDGCEFTGGKDDINVIPYSEAEFNNANTAQIDIVWLDSTHFIVAFQDQNDSNHGKAIIGEIDGSYNITYGSASDFNSAGTYYISVDKLDSTHFVIAYRDDGNSSYGTAIIGETDGDTTISGFGSENVFNSTTTHYIDIAVLDSTHFVISYRDDGNSGYGTAIVGVTDGDRTINSYGSENVFNSAITNYIKIAALDSTHFVISYQDAGNSSYGTAIIGVTDGSTTISSYGTENVFHEGETSGTIIAALDSTYFVVIYINSSGSDYGATVIGETDGNTTISSYGAETTFNADDLNYLSLAALDSTHFIIAYSDIGNNSYGTVRIGTIIDKYVYYTEKYIFTETATIVTSVDSNIVAFRGTDSDGYAQYIDYSLPHSYCITSTGTNNTISDNQFYGTSGKSIEYAIDVSGNKSGVHDNQIYGSQDGSILHGIIIDSNSSRSRIDGNNISGVDKIALVNDGENTIILNTMANDNGNMIARSDCENEVRPMLIDDANDPATDSNATFVRDSGKAYQGTYSFLYTHTSTGSAGIAYLCDGTGTSDMHGLTAGKTYTLKCYYYRSSSNGADGELNLRTYDGASWTENKIGSLTADDAWHSVEEDIAIPSDTEAVQLRIDSESATGSGDTCYYDEVRLYVSGVHNEHETQFLDIGTSTMVG